MEIDIITRVEIESILQAKFEAFVVQLKELSGLNTSDKLYNSKEASKYLKVCSKTLQNYRDNGLIRYSQKGRKIFYSQEDLNQFVETHKSNNFFNNKNK